MGQNSLDQYIKSKLENHQVHIDSEAVWHSIELDRRNRKIYYLIFGAVTILFLSTLYFSFFLSNSKEANTKLAADTPLVQIKDLDKQSNENTSLLIGSKPESDEQPIEESIEPDLKESSNKTFSDNNINTTQFENSESNEDFLRPSGIDRSINAPEMPSSREALSSGNYEKDAYILKKDIKLISFENLDAISHELDTERGIEKLDIHTSDCPSFSNKSNSLLIEAYTFLDYSIDSYNTSAEYQNYLDERKASQSYRPSYRAGIQAKYLFPNGLFIRAGIEYGVKREKFRYRTETTTTEILPNQIINIHIDMNGDSTITYGNAPVTTVETKNWRIKNSYSAIDIPFSIGYQIDQGKWFYGLELGASYNLKFNFTGMLLDDSLIPYKAEDYFKNKTGINYTMGLSAGYKIRPGMNLMLRLGLRSVSSKINQANNIIDQKYTMVGTGLGLEYEF